MSAAINLFNTSDPTQAELILADLWAKSARKEGHRRGLPIAINGGDMNNPGPVTLKVAELSRKLAPDGGTVTISQIIAGLPEYQRTTIDNAMRAAVAGGLLKRVGKNPFGVNVYEVA